MIKYASLLLLCWLSVVNLPGQTDTYSFYQKKYTTDDGLSSRFIQDIYQDSRNYIWVSSDYGVNRFDGQNFKVYNQGRYHLQSDNIVKIREDQRGNLWLIDRTNSAKNGVKYWRKTTVDVLTFSTDSLQSLEGYISENLPFAMSSITSIAQDPSYALWISTLEGKVYKYTDRFTEVIMPDGLIEGRIIRPLHNGGFLMLGPGKVTRLDADLQTIFQTNFPKQIEEIVEGKEGRIYLITQADRIPYEIKSGGEITVFNWNDIKGTGNQRVYRFGVDDANRTWIEGLDNSITLYEEGKKIENVDLYRVELGHSFNSRFIMLGDRSGGLWYADRDGLNYMSFNQSGFTPYMTDRKISLRGLYKLTDSTFFVNTYSGYFELNVNTGYYEPYDEVDYSGFSQCGILWNDHIYNSMYAPKVIKINIKDQTTNYLKMGDEFFYSKIFISSPDSTILVGSTTGLFVLNPATDSIVAYEKYNAFPDLKNREVNNFMEVGNQIYITTDKGLYILDWEKGIVAKRDFKFNHLLYLYHDREGVNWIATRGGGLLEWNPAEENTVRQYTVENGLSHDIIYAIYEDAANQLWLSSSKGLICFNKKNKTVITYSKLNGLTDNEFNQYAHFQDRDGKIYVGGVNGLVSFDPAALQDLPVPETAQRIVATEITVTRNDNKTYNCSENEMNNGEALVLKGDIQSASIKFSLLEYDRQENSQFFYKINSIHDTWQKMSDRYLRLSGLPGGTYTIEIMVHAGIRMEIIKSSIQVKILKPFTETWLFFGICALGFLALGISLSRYRIYHLDRINRSLEQKVKRRTQKIEDDKVLISQQYREMAQINKTKDHLIAIIGHDLKDYVSTFEGIEQKINYLISSKQVERIPHLAEFIENSAHDLSLLLDNLLNWALKERGDLLLHPDSVNVLSILQDVLKRLNNSIAKKEITFISKIPADLSMYADGLTLHSLLRNIIHNAIKFSHRKEVIKIYHTEKDNFVTLHIEDRGIGMTQYQMDQVLTETDAAISTRGTENEGGTGMGLLLCREMLEMQSGTISVVSEQNKGTTFSIILPKRIPSSSKEEINV